MLTEEQRVRILGRVRIVLTQEDAFEFSASEPVDLGHRSLLTFHCRGAVHAALWPLHNTAAQFLHTSQEQRRVNFHFSVDGIM